MGLVGGGRWGDEAAGHGRLQLQKDTQVHEAPGIAHMLLSKATD